MKYKNLSQYKDLWGENLLIGALGGLIFYLGFCLNYGGVTFVKTIFTLIFGALGGLLPDIFAKHVRANVPLVRSWAMVATLFLLLPVVRPTFYAEVFIYGYIFSLLWTARAKRLPDV